MFTTLEGVSVPQVVVHNNTSRLVEQLLLSNFWTKHFYYTV